MRLSTLLFGFFTLLLSTSVYGQNPAEAEASMDYYLPQDVTYNSEIPTPEEVLGMVPGEWHVRHDQLVKYMEAVAEASDRITLHKFAETYEDRPLLYLTVTSASNQQNIEQIRKNHVALTNPERSEQLDTENMPIVMYWGYSIHGDESSGSNASLLVAYYLAAAQGKEIEQKLNNSVILLDPSLNPDGLNRFASWANTHKSENLVSDPNSLELNQRWPSGRTNHYWFDLNRDWMLVQHPESQGRIDNFHKWKPNILTDHHEMGTNSTFFFQPGIQSRTHPITPEQNQSLTKAIADYHAEKLDNQKRLYYSQESFDDFYYGKGSTYPDVNGGIGILFEQASSRGHAQESVHGVLKYPFTIKNQFLTSLSTWEASQNLRQEILNYQRSFFQESKRKGEQADIEGYVFGTSHDKARTHHFVEMLKRHKVKLYELAKNINADGESFQANSSFVIPSDQKQYKFVKALFERRTSFTDSLFYDVSAWTMPYAFNLPFAELEGRDYSDDLLGSKVDGVPELPQGEIVGGKSDYAYVFEWDEYYAPRALNRLQDADVRTKVASKPFTGVTANGTHRFDYGTVLVPVGPQSVDESDIYSLMKKAANEDGLTVYAVGTGMTPRGIDLGSGSFEDLEQPNVAVLAGEGASSYEVGEVWHLLDQRYDMTLTLFPPDRLSFADLSRYNVIVMVNGGYNSLSNGAVSNIKDWVQSGGTLITTKYANRWAERNDLANIEFVKEDNSKEDEKEVNPKPYAERDKARGAQYIGGAIFNAKLDLTHPLGYGYNDDEMTVFRNSTLFLQKAENPYATPLYYTEEPLASGYISEENLEELAGTASIIVSDTGRGRVISMTDNPNFRAFWYGTNKLFMNAIFFGQTIDGGSGN
ncbi:M14 family metallopeptidase [Fodinibius halophilus]|uniref:Zinc carboxypeptidase n=1 Tax=Fodinibius halophilus TaxID=1736908 RepID=A0A6M1ST11_9BACT|nr:M14 family metallopeptidase [Fodinibius halophilus]NGP87068.1 zinc carboxypeptidase [Fodinibius halophilus]